MLTWILDRQLRPGTSRPRWLRGLLDETFLWVAAGELLLVLGVRQETVRSLAVLQGILEEYRAARRAAGEEVLRLDDITTVEDLDRLGDTGEGSRRDIEDIVPAETLARWIDDGAPVLLDVAEGVLVGLDRRRVRPELVGLDPRGTRELLRRVRRSLRAEDLPARAAEGEEPFRAAVERLGAELEELEDGSRTQTRPVAPALGEVRRLVGILRDLPPRTQQRLIPLRLLRSRTVLTAAVTRWLASLREETESPAEGAGTVGIGAAGGARAGAGNVTAGVDPAAEELARPGREQVRRQRERRHQQELRDRALRGLVAAPARAALHAVVLLVLLGVAVHVWMLGAEPVRAPSGTLTRLGVVEVGAMLSAHLLNMVLLVAAEQQGGVRRVLRPGVERTRSRLLDACSWCGSLAWLGVFFGVFALVPGRALRGGDEWDPQVGDRVFAPGIAALDPGVLTIAAVVALTVPGLALGALLGRVMKGRVPQRPSEAGHPG